MHFIVIIPARYESTRLLNKPLIDINGKSMIVRVLDKARESGADRVIVATDHKKIAHTVEKAGGEVCMTRSDHHSGTERLSEVVKKFKFHDSTIIINIQGDEPMIPSSKIRKVAENLVHFQSEVATLAVPIHDVKEIFDPNIVKVVIDVKGYALYFSRATIPWDHNCFSKNRKVIRSNFLRHIGVYSYRVDFIRRFTDWKLSPLEQIEMLEQLRVLWYGGKIHVSIVENTTIVSVDTPNDLVRVRYYTR